LRRLFHAEGVRVQIDQRDWGLLAGMGAAVPRADFAIAGISTFAQATALCTEMAAASGAEYTLADLLC
jgi:hypothetical protein